MRGDPELRDWKSWRTHMRALAVATEQPEPIDISEDNLKRLIRIACAQLTELKAMKLNGMPRASNSKVEE